MRKKIEAGLKAKIALEAFRGEKTIAQISSEYGVHPNQVGKWKQELLKNAGAIFGSKNGKSDNGQLEMMDKLYRNIGELKVENDWLKKKLDILGLKKEWH